MRNKPLSRFLCLLLGIVLAAGALPLGSFANDRANETEGSTTALKSDIQTMNLTGYVGENLVSNVKNWQIDAYRNNRGIIEQILLANSDTLSLNSILGTDWFGVDNYYTVDIVEGQKGNALGWTLKNLPGSFSDRDLRFVNDPTAATDWSGATDLCVFVDASSVPSAVQVRIAFEENAVGRESYELKQGASVYLTENEAETEVKVLSGGFISLPSGFCGNVRMPLNNDTFCRYWQEGGNNKLDLNKTVQFQLCVKADGKAVGKTVTMDDFTLLGAFGQKTVWDFEALVSRSAGGNVGNGNIQKWYGEFVGKLLQGMAYCYQATSDGDLASAANEIIDELAKAQGKDGYLGVFVGADRYALSGGNWDLWNQYHCISGLLEWYKLTGNETALAVAKRAIDRIYETFKDRSYIVSGGFETNRGIAHGYAQMYQITDEEKYLNEAVRIIEEDCKSDANGWYQMALQGKDFVDSNCLRWEVLHMIMTLGILYEETGNKEYYTVMSRVFESILKTDVHNAGTFTTNEGACGSPYAEGIVETCCTVAWAAFANEYYKYNQSVRVADELERSYLNGILGSLLDNDKYCTYNTPVNGIKGSASFHGGGYDGRRVPSQEDISFQYNTASPDMNCCQANYARGIGQISQWAVMSGKGTLYVNYYGASSITTLIDGKPIILTQETKYPLNGAIKLTVSGLEKETEFTLKLRVPAWAHGTKVSYDGNSVMAKCGEYFEIKKTFRNGDEILLDIALSFTYWAGEENQSGLTSVFYGPILLTLDGNYAANVKRNAPFTREDIENAVISEGGGSDVMLFAFVKTEGKLIRLVDFASAGKYNGKSEPATYYTWLNVEGSPCPKQGVTWQNTDKQTITFGQNIDFDTALAYEGQSVTFRVNLPEGKRIDKIEAQGVTVTEENGLYRFVMPAEPLTVSVSFADLEKDPVNPPDDKDETPPDTPDTPDTPDQEKEPDKSPSSLFAVLGGAAAVIAAAVIAFLLLKKKKAA